MVSTFYREMIARLIEDAQTNPEAAELVKMVQETSGLSAPVRRALEAGWIKADDLQFEADETKHLLGGKVLPARKMILLSGLPKEGKTYIALEVASAVASGDRLFGRYDITKPGAVYYFDFENGEEEIGIRLLRRSDIGRGLPLYFSFTRQNLAGEGGTELLNSLPEPPSLVIVDSLRSSMPFRDENDASEAVRLLGAWSKWAHENATVLFLHHNNKMTQGDGIQRISGTSAIPAVCDGCWIMKQRIVAPDSSRYWKLDVVGRAGMSGEIVLRMDTRTTRVEEVDEEEWNDVQHAQKEQEEASMYEQAVEQARRLGNFTIEQLARSVKRRTNIARSLVNKMTAAGLVELLPSGRYVFVLPDRE